MFLTDVGLVPIPAFPDLWYLDGDLVYESESGVRITAPKGFITDDASIPKFLDWIPFLDRQGLSRRPGIIHDALYSLGRGRGKVFADDMLHEMCIAEGMSFIGAELIYQGVNLFGDPSWNKDRGHGCFFPVPASGNFIDLDSWSDWKGSLFS